MIFWDRWSVNREIVARIAVDVVGVHIHEGDCVAVSKIDNGIAADLLDSIREIVDRCDIGSVDPLGDLQNVLTSLEIENNVIATATTEDECVAARAAMKHIVAFATIQDIGA
jgi:hypothetical protein